MAGEAMTEDANTCPHDIWRTEQEVNRDDVTGELKADPVLTVRYCLDCDRTEPRHLEVQT